MVAIILDIISIILSAIVIVLLVKDRRKEK